MNQVKIDATNKSLGRISSQIARILMDKDNENFAKNKVFEGTVVIENLQKAAVNEKKFSEKKYYSHSGYLGNLKETTLKFLWAQNPENVLREMVKKMLPDNKLRNLRLKKIKFVK